jgi:hypothetical protein
VVGSISTPLNNSPPYKTSGLIMIDRKPKPLTVK